MAKQSIREIARENQKQYKIARKIKTFKGEFWTVNSIFGNDWAIFYILLGGRSTGKSYAVMRWACLNKIKKGDNLKFYWMRLTHNAKQKLLANGADKLIDPDIKRKLEKTGVKFTTNNDSVYTYKEEEKEIKHRDGTTSNKIYKTQMKEFCTILDCSTMGSDKGVAYFDNEYKGEYVVVLDEMNREQGEPNRFDIVYNFVNAVENVVRETHVNIKVIMIGNTLDEASDILCAFNFIPDTFGRYKLKRKRCVVDYIKPSEAYLKRRKESIASIMMPNASTFTNEVEIDRSLIINKRLAIKPMQIIKFTKDKDTWFTLWNNNIIKPYNKENINNIIAMRRYLDEQFTALLQTSIIEQWDARTFRFDNLSTFKRFQKNMKLLKKE
jgi:hypothetical protein